MDNITLVQWVGAILLILVFLTVCVLFIIYYTTVGQEKVLRGLDLIHLKLVRDNFCTLLKGLPGREVVETALKEIRELETLLGVEEKDFTKEIEEYEKLKTLVDERGYI